MVDFEHYVVRAEGMEWADIVISEKLGLFCAYSTFGNYVYRWTSIGSRTLKQFLAGLDRDYFMEKTRGRAWKEFDLDATIADIKRHVLELRRAGDLTADQARAAWEDIGDLDDGPVSDGMFMERVYRSTALWAVYGGDFYDLTIETPKLECAGFWRVIWPAFLEQIAEKEVARPDGKPRRDKLRLCRGFLNALAHLRPEFKRTASVQETHR